MWITKVPSLLSPKAYSDSTMDYTVLEFSRLSWRIVLSPTLQAASLPAESQGKPKNTGMGSLSLLQRIFPTQKLNRGLLHRRQILYPLSYQGSNS